MQKIKQFAVLKPRKIKVKQNLIPRREVSSFTRLQTGRRQRTDITAKWIMFSLISRSIKLLFSSTVKKGGIIKHLVSVDVGQYFYIYYKQFQPVQLSLKISKVFQHNQKTSSQPMLLNLWIKGIQVKISHLQSSVLVIFFIMHENLRIINPIDYRII